MDFDPNVIVVLQQPFYTEWVHMDSGGWGLIYDTCVHSLSKAQWDLRIFKNNSKLYIR